MELAYIQILSDKIAKEIASF
ncbi:hypothetical protein KL86DES1_20760 [uncultured Desulfovibrio sp.]|uniref:Uncharacterized protein n=1 Tax=uncultured Desulfovibrio sp. TaxID=167968 RepID=A0A212L554_9BACT|nr:hypothetical protein KL86DES1_20760 [uncultured Desulfovibrio sp.]VZH33661.1 conserved protein of unknown function [Desulfovibrio sp. 86]